MSVIKCAILLNDPKLKYDNNGEPYCDLQFGLLDESRTKQVGVYMETLRGDYARLYDAMFRKGQHFALQLKEGD